MSACAQILKAKSVFRAQSFGSDNLKAISNYCFLQTEIYFEVIIAYTL